MINNNFNVIGKKNYQSSVSNADREIPNLGSTDNAGNSVNLVSGIAVHANLIRFMSVFQPDLYACCFTQLMGYIYKP